MGISPTRRKRNEIVGFIRPDDLEGYDPPHIGEDKDPFILYVRIYIIYNYRKKINTSFLYKYADKFANGFFYFKNYLNLCNYLN